MSHIVGMDFGTTNSGMAIYDGQRLHTLPIEGRSRVSPTALYITNDREVFIGREAIDTYYRHNLNRPTKMQRVWVGEIEQTFAEVGTFIKDVYIEKDVYSPGRLFLSFKMGLASQEYVGTLVGNYFFTLEDIIATYLYTTRRRAEAQLEVDLDTIVLGCPVRYSDKPEADAFARERMIQSAFRAGYKTVYMQYEPLAAATYYESTLDHDENALIFDFGGGTLDISVLRLGRDRQIMANGGIPIAGNVFDTRIVRAKMPAHFGEGEGYYSSGKKLAIPNLYYEAFSSWQDILTLQMPDTLSALHRIAPKAQNPHKIHALISLISGHYGLKMYDVAEAAKIQVSQVDRTPLHFDGKGFRVRDTLSRSEFERFIRHDTQDIAERLDSVITASGLKPHQIDSVIRTGGSSEIPTFIDMLAQRFGAEKIKAVDIFGSVTSGLGFVANEIMNGKSPLPAYHSETARMMQRVSKDFALVDLDQLTRLIDLKETRSGDEGKESVLILRDSQQEMHAVRYDLETTPALPHAPDEIAALLPANERLILLTTEYRAVTRTARQLSELTEIGVKLEALEDFTSNAFGREVVCAITPLTDLPITDDVLMLSTLGYSRRINGAKLLERLAQPVSYTMPRLRGYPLGLVRLPNGGELLILAQGGRMVRLAVDKITRTEERLLSVPLKSGLVAAVGLPAPAEVLVATQSGYVIRLNSADLPLTSEVNTTGEKVITRAHPVAMRPYHAERSYALLSTQRFIFLSSDLLDSSNDQQPLIRLNKGEALKRLILL